MDLREALEAIRRRIAVLFENPFDVRVELPPVDIEEQLSSHRSGLLLGIYSEAGLVEALEASGGLAALRRRVGADVRVRVFPDEGVVRIYYADAADRPEGLLVEVKAHIERGGPDSALPPSLRALDFLALDWLLLQDPRRRFPPGRRPLPGQAHPGLAIGPHVLEAVTRSARRLGAAGVLGIPMYYHAAVIYHRAFAYADPVEEGRFQALQRDLAGLPLDEAAWAVHQGRVRDATFDQPLRWQGKEMIQPLSEAARAHFAAPAYIDAAARTLLGTRFVLAP